MGNLIESVEHGDQVLALYDGEKHRKLVDLLNHDPKTLVGVYSSICTWMLGYSDRAVRLNDEKDAHARRRAHPFDLGFALTVGAEVFDYRCEPDELRKRAEECERLGRDNRCRCCGHCWHPLAMAWHSSGKARQLKALPRLRPA